jgi:hypothetical protein
MPGKKSKFFPRYGARMHQDDFDHARYVPFLRARAQSHFRKEIWDISFEDWCSLWSTPELWAQRGRASASLALVRLDPEDDWTWSNVQIMSRRQWLQEHRKGRGPNRVRK